MEEEIKKALEQHLRIRVRRDENIFGSQSLFVRLYWDEELISESSEYIEDLCEQ